MGAWDPRRRIESLSTEPNGFTPCRLPGRVAGRIRAAANRNETRLVTASEDGAALVLGRLRVIVSAARRDVDGHVWIHLSVSHTTGRLPSWTDLVHARDVIVGDDVEAYQVAPPRARYVNRHPGCLHLWADMEGPVLPAFESMASDGELTV